MPARSGKLKEELIAKSVIKVVGLGMKRDNFKAESGQQATRGGIAGIDLGEDLFQLIVIKENINNTRASLAGITIAPVARRQQVGDKGAISISNGSLHCADIMARRP